MFEEVSTDAPLAIVVVPNHLPHLNVLDAWAPHLAGVPVVVMQDIGEKPRYDGPLDVTIYDHGDVERLLGDKAWIIPSRTSACRSFGYLMAYARNPGYVLTLDNDCYPDGSLWPAGHISNLQRTCTLGWVNSGQAGAPLFRGFPYDIRDASSVYLSHGLWSGVPDLDAVTALSIPDYRADPWRGVKVIPRDNYFPMCGMNLAWRTELTPALYFGLFGPDYGFDQYDDIWAGVLVKRVLDHLGWAAVSGAPSVQHRKQSNVFTNLRKQAPGLAMNEQFYRAVSAVDIPTGQSTVTDVYRTLITGLPDAITDEPEGWTAKFKAAALLWVALFE